MSELMMPQHANILGNVFGGVVLALVDRVAAVAAIRHAGKPCVTVSVDKVDFREPIHVGELLTAYARVDRKSTRLNSSHGYISYAVFCLKKKNLSYSSKLAALGALTSE